MNSIINLILAAAILFSAAPEQVATVESLNRCDDYTIQYNYSGAIHTATVSGYDFNIPPTVGDGLKLYAVGARFTGAVSAHSGEIWKYTDDSGRVWDLFPRNDCNNEQRERATLIYSDNGTPEQIEDDFLVDFLEV